MSVAPIHWDELERRIDDSADRYRSAAPFPFVVFDDFLDQQACQASLEEFRALDDQRWQGFIHINERKFSHTDPTEWGPELQRLLADLNSPKFLELLTKLTGIEGLKADPALEGGGLHRSGQGGFLNVHADYTVHPHHQHWARRVNLLLYMNQDWDLDYGGDLELWARNMSKCQEKIAPLFNRAVIFSTESDSFHGHPIPMTCPSDIYRRSLALYYFTEEEKPIVHSTNYQARPEDGWKKILISADRRALQAYDWLKRKTGISDDRIHKIFGSIDRLRSRSKKTP
jgi:hypothetical protein